MGKYNLIPLCLYQNYNSGSYVSQSCNSVPETEFEKKFYVLEENDEITPPGMSLFCFRNTPNVDYSTTDVHTVYDPFNQQKGCLRFYAWVSPVPYSTPLYIWKRGNDVHISFDSKEPKGYEPELFSPIYVLLDPRDDGVRVPGFSNNKFKIIDNKSVFAFSRYQGRCLPNPDGVPLDECMGDGKDLGEEPTLLNYLEDKYTANNSWKEYLLIAISFLFIVMAVLYTVKRK